MDKNERALNAKTKDELIAIIIRKDNVEAKLMRENSELNHDLHNLELMYDALQDTSKGTEEALFKYYAEVRKWRKIATVSWCALAAVIVCAILAALFIL